MMATTLAKIDHDEIAEHRHCVLLAAAVKE
jgi:hypothetical protein